MDSAGTDSGWFQTLVGGSALIGCRLCPDLVEVGMSALENQQNADEAQLIFTSYSNLPGLPWAMDGELATLGKTSKITLYIADREREREREREKERERKSMSTIDRGHVANIICLSIYDLLTQVRTAYSVRTMYIPGSAQHLL